MCRRRCFFVTESFHHRYFAGCVIAIVNANTTTIAVRVPKITSRRRHRRFASRCGVASLRRTNSAASAMRLAALATRRAGSVRVLLGTLSRDAGSTAPGAEILRREASRRLRDLTPTTALAALNSPSPCTSSHRTQMRESVGKRTPGITAAPRCPRVGSVRGTHARHYGRTAMSVATNDGRPSMPGSWFVRPACAGLSVVFE
jgi:hypothetical protein